MPNRAERRKIAKQMTPQHIESVVVDAIKRERAEQKRRELEILEVWIVMTAYTLNYKLGLGKKRLPEIIDKIVENIDCFRTGQLKKNDYKEIKKIVKGLGVSF